MEFFFNSHILKILRAAALIGYYMFFEKIAQLNKTIEQTLLEICANFKEAQ